MCLPAALLLRTALRVYREAHTLARAFSNAPEVARATFGILSYSPAPDIPAKSSTLAVLLTITVASLPNALSACPIIFSTAPGRGPGGGGGGRPAGGCSGWRKGAGGKGQGEGLEREECC